MCLRMRGCIFILFICLMIPACSTAPPAETELMKHVEGIDATAREIQVLMYRYAEHFSGQVDLAATRICNATDDYDIRMAAFQWVTLAVSEMMKHCFHFDPLNGMLAASVYCIQLNTFFETGNGKHLFGPYQHIAIETMERLRMDLLYIVREVWPDGDIEEYRRKVNEFAEAHPIENTRFVRAGYDIENIRLSGADRDMGLRLAGSMNAQLLALTDRANILTAHVQRQLHWQKEMLLAQTTKMITDMTDSTVTRAMETMDPIMEFLAEQRDLTARDLAHERAAVLTAIASERNAVLQAIAHERSATMEDISRITLETLERISSSSQAGVEASIGQVFIRLTKLMTIPFIGLALFTLIVMIWVRSAVNRYLDIKARQAESN